MDGHDNPLSAARQAVWRAERRVAYQRAIVEAAESGGGPQLAEVARQTLAELEAELHLVRARLKADHEALGPGPEWLEAAAHDTLRGPCRDQTATA